MATITKQCSVFNAFNFRRDVFDSVGHVVSLKIGDTDLPADMTLKEPIEEGELKVVGAISSFSWEGGYAQPIQIAMQISRERKTDLATLLHKTMKSVAVDIQFVIYEYDRDKEVFYESVHTNDVAINCLLQVQGRDRVIYLSDEPGHEVETPVNYQLVLGLVPDEKEQQEIHIALGQEQKFVKQFGITKG